MTTFTVIEKKNAKAAQTEARKKFIEKLKDAYPNPNDATRQQTEFLIPRWWPLAAYQES